LNKGYYIGSVEEAASKKGWLIGSFLKKNNPCFTEAVEVGWKELDTKTKIAKHIHKLATEITVIIKGSTTEIINGQQLVLKAGNYVIIHPFTPAETLHAEEGTIVLVIKTPSVPGDKYSC